MEKHTTHNKMEGANLKQDIPPQAGAQQVELDLLPSHAALPRSSRGFRYYFAKISQFWLLATGLIVWEVVSKSIPSMAILLPPPTRVAAVGFELVQNGMLQRDVLSSLKRVAVAMVFASLIGCALGLALGGSRRFAWSVEPVVNFFRPIPPLAWIPFSILWFGIGDIQNEFIIFLGAVFPILLNTMEGVRSVDGQLIRAAQALGASRTMIVHSVILPAALPQIFVGLRVGVGIAWMALVAGELVAATSGLGYLIMQGRVLFRAEYIVIGMLLIGLIGLMLDALIKRSQLLVMPWVQVER